MLNNNRLNKRKWEKRNDDYDDGLWNLHISIYF